MVAKLLSVCVYIIGTSVGGTVGEMEDLTEHSVLLQNGETNYGYGACQQ